MSNHALELLASARQTADVQKSLSLGSGGHGYSQVPKSWFVSPYEVLSDIGLDYQHEPSAVTYETLRSMWKTNIVVHNAVLVRQNQVAAFAQRQANEYSVGFAIQHREHKHHKYTASDLDYRVKMEHFILNCGVDDDEDRDDFETFIRKIARDRLTLDQVCFEKIPSHMGKPASFHAVDAATIRLRRRPNRRNRPMTDEEAADAVRYVQYIDGEIVTHYTTKQMAFGVANPRTDISVAGYGWSELEALITTITYHLFGEQWNQKVFSQGSTVKGLLNLHGNIPPNQLEAFKRQWLTQISGVGNAWRTPIFNAEKVEWIPLQPSNMDMGYEQWMNYLIKNVTAAYLMDPAEINFDMRSSAGNQPMFMTTNEAQQKVSKDKGLQPLLRFIAKLINKHILWPINPAWEFVFKGIDAKSEEQAIELSLKEAQTFKTVNEIRRERGLPPIEGGDIVANPTLVSYLQQQQQMKANEAQQQQAMAQQQGGAPQPGQPGPPPQQGAIQPPTGTSRMQQRRNADAGMEALLGAGGGPRPAHGAASAYDPVSGAQGGPPESPFPSQPGEAPETETAHAGEALEREAISSPDNEGSNSSSNERYPMEWESTIHASANNEIIKSLTGTARMLRRLSRSF